MLKDLDQEIHEHIEMATRDNIECGMSPEEARYAALRKFGNVTRVKEDARAVWSLVWLEQLLQDIRFGLRMVCKSPAFTSVAILTLALGIGANTAIFSVMNAVLLRFLPVPNAERLVYLHFKNQTAGTSQTGYGDMSLSEPTFEALRTQRQVFSDLVGFVPLSFAKTIVRFGDSPEEAAADMVSGDFFSGLGVLPVRGRVLTMEDESQHTQVLVLSYNYWTRRFARNPSILGQTLFIKGIPFTIVGVAAQHFFGVQPEGSTDLWIPLQTMPQIKPWGASPQDKANLYGSPDWWFFMMVGRLAPGLSEQQALARLQPVYEQVAHTGTTGPRLSDQPSRLYFTPARGIAGLRDTLETPLRALMVTVGLVLIIACGNVAMLLVARNSARQREFSLRSALGAGYARLFRQLLSESLLLVAAGGAAGWLLALWASQALAHWAGFDVNLAPDRTVLLFTLAISLAAALVFGFAPLRSVARVPPWVTLRTSGTSARQDRTGFRSGQIVVAVQMALCLVLLVCAGLAVRSLLNLQNADLGLRAQGLLVFGITPPQSLHNDAEVVRFFQGLTDRLRILPGVESATLLQNRPGVGDSNNTNVYVDGVQPHEKLIDSLVRWNSVGSDFFHVMGTPVLLGRDFTDADSPSSLRVTIVNQTFVDRYLPGREPLGHRIALDDVNATSYTIVGLAQNSKYTEVRERDLPMAYFPYTQTPDISTMQIELRTHGNPAAFLSSVQSVVRDFGPDLAPLQPMTQQAQFEASFSQEHLFARLALFFGLLAAILVATGLYGTLAYRVGRRTAEIGVRMALGARPQQVLWMVMRESFAVSIAGILLGLPLAIAGAHLLRSLFFGLSPEDPLALIAAVLGTCVVALAAGLIPALRATRVDPMIALRYE
jgi:predicted permease